METQSITLVHNSKLWNISDCDQKTCFVNVECPSCNSGIAYIAWHDNYSTGFCPNCSQKWLEN